MVVLKDNVNKFNEDVERTGTYQYTGDRLSSIMSNKRLSDAILSVYDFKNKKVLDIGCGDGVYSFDYVNAGAKSVLGIDPARNAIDYANKFAEERNLSDKINFKVMNIYALELTESFDVIILRGVLHHLPDAKKALELIVDYAGTIIICEPNGYNPILKIIEKVSKYHVEHEEQSFALSTIMSWLSIPIYQHKYVGLVPFFAPDWLAKMCKFFEPLVEAIPFVRNICCGQYIMIAEKRK